MMFKKLFSPSPSNVRISVAIAAASVALSAGVTLAGDPGAAGDMYMMMGDFSVQQYDGVTGALVGTFATSNGQIRDLTFGPNGNLFVLNNGDGQVDEFDGTTGAFIQTLVTGINVGESMVFLDSGNLLVSNLGTSDILEYDGTTGALVGTFATGLEPLQNSMVIGPNGNVFAGDRLTNSVMEFMQDGTALGIFAGGDGTVTDVEGISFGGPNNNLFVAAFTSKNVAEYDGTTGAFIGDFATGFTCTDGLRFALNGNLWVSDVCGNFTNVYDDAGNLVMAITDGMNAPRSMALKPGGVLDCLTMTVSTLTGGSVATWDVSGATAGSKVAVVWGTKAGSTVVSGQLGFCATFGIKGVNQSKLVGLKTADGAGNVQIKKKIPGSASGLNVLTQAAEQGTCPDECVSGVDTQTVQ